MKTLFEWCKQKVDPENDDDQNRNQVCSFYYVVVVALVLLGTAWIAQTMYNCRQCETKSRERVSFTKAFMVSGAVYLASTLVM